MKKLVLALAVAAAAASAPAQAQRFGELGILALDPVDDGNTVLTVNGRGAVLRQADVAAFSAGVTTVGTTAEEALRENARTMNAVIAAARKLGIAEKDIQTSTVSISPVMSNDRNAPRYGLRTSGRVDRVTTIDIEDAVEASALAVAKSAIEDDEAPRIIGYRATNSVGLRQRDLESFGKTIDALVKAGANEVEGPDFQLEESASSEEEAKLRAIKDAQERARVYADAAGLRVVRIVMMDEGRVSGLSSRRGNQFGFWEAQSAGLYDMYSETPVLSGELTIVASVSMLLELAPK